MAKRGERNRSEQQHFEGTGPAKNSRVHPKAVAYVKARDARMLKTKDEKEAKTALLEAMLIEGLEEYEYGPLKVTVHNNRDVKVKLEGQDGEGGDE